MTVVVVESVLFHIKQGAQVVKQVSTDYCRYIQTGYISHSRLTCNKVSKIYVPLPSLHSANRRAVLCQFTVGAADMCIV